MNNLSIKQIQSGIASGEFTCKEVVEFYLRNVGEKAHLGAFLEVFEEEALSRAGEIDEKIKSGNFGKLAGLVIGIKDVLSYKGHKVQASSKILEGYVAPYSATVVDRLLEQDAIIIGRQSCDEFAMGASNENSHYGPVKNGLNENKVPGGSSGGSAVAVQMAMCHASLGSDTGGSVRQPAAFCGVFGMKPTYSRVSRYGLLAYASSFDQVGVLANNLEDTALILEVIAGEDNLDATASKEKVETYSDIQNKPAPLKICYIKDCLEHESIQEEVINKTRDQIQALKSNRHTVDPVDFPYLDYMVPTYYILTTAEASSNLSRYDGVRYGYRTEKKGTLEEMYKNTRSEGFGKEVKRRIMLGTFALSASYYDAYYTKAQEVRALIKSKTEEILKEYDYIVLPTTPGTAFELGSNQKDPIQMYLEDIFTVQASLAGLPAISVPNGVDNDGMPIGFQIIGRPFDESGVLNLAKEIV